MCVEKCEGIALISFNSKYHMPFDNITVQYMHLCVKWILSSIVITLWMRVLAALHYENTLIQIY